VERPRRGRLGTVLGGGERIQVRDHPALCLVQICPYDIFNLYSEERVRKGAEKLQKFLSAKQQGRLDGFFTVKPKDDKGRDAKGDAKGKGKDAKGKGKDAKGKDTKAGVKRKAEDKTEASKTKKSKTRK
jgi:hypothetical protein